MEHAAAVIPFLYGIVVGNAISLLAGGLFILRHWHRQRMLRERLGPPTA
ncbi:hypothetical protein HNW77_01295 [Komagataeibacter sp. AV436]|uniref:DUF2062 domain-containing protein n=1 Tax=Komagataeibacter melomenusus TaxID=2766578 RepID=A0ABX2AB63_9PROT|nr:hypothetical protein [Komagataeibacter melomenusus]MBV1829738.1 hypothetical protein [Komagataeibacter melomenusus]NPC65061.1 hypothetical protein [Komagataeibacter melomenusus]